MVMQQTLIALTNHKENSLLVWMGANREILRAIICLNVSSV